MLLAKGGRHQKRLQIGQIRQSFRLKTAQKLPLFEFAHSIKLGCTRSFLLLGQWLDLVACLGIRLKRQVTEQGPHVLEVAGYRAVHLPCVPPFRPLLLNPLHTVLNAHIFPATE